MGRHEGMGGHVESLVSTRRGIAEMTAADYEQPRCQQCGARLSDHDGYGLSKIKKYCSDRCRVSAYRRRNGLAAKPKTNRWAPTYEQARHANGAWVEVPCKTKRQAYQLQVVFSNKRGFESSRNGLVVSLRFMGVA